MKLEVLLVLTVLSTVTVSSVYADGIVVKFDKSQYHTGDSLTITGNIAELKMPVIAISIFDPNGTILSANSVEIDPDGLFTKTIFLDSPFYEKSGEYKVKLDYGKISQNEFFTIINDITPQEIVEQPITPEIISLTTDRQKYADNDTITISGYVSTLDSPTVLIGIYDTFGGPAGFYFGQISPDLKFSTHFLAKYGVNFKVDGTYSIKAHYGESSKTISFDFESVIGETVPEIFHDEPTTDESTAKDEQHTTNDSPTTDQDDPPIVKTENIEESDIPSTNTQNKSNNDDSIIKNTSNQNSNEEKSNNDTSVIKDSQPSKEQRKSQKESTQIIKDDNLSVEDIELGLMLNQINLNCDSSMYTDTITYYDGMGPALYRLCKFDSSLNFFNDSLVDEPKNVEILTNKASALGKLGRASEAIIYYDQALNINPGFLPAINNKANTLANLGQYDEAKKLYESAIEKNPDYNTARKNLLLLTSRLPQTIPDYLEQQPIQQINYELENNPPVIDDLANREKLEPQNDQPLSFFEEVSAVFSSLFGFLK